MDEAIRKAIRILDDLVCEPTPVPYLIDDEYARLIKRAESLPCNQDGADKSWVFQAMQDYIELKKRTRLA